MPCAPNTYFLPISSLSQVKIVLSFSRCIPFFVLFPLLPLVWQSSEQHLVLPFLQELFKALHAPTGQVLFSQFRLLFHLLETSDGLHHRRTIRLSRQRATMLLRKVRYAFSLDPSLLRKARPLKTGIYFSLSYLVNQADEQS